ncbi:MAG: iron-sulfur cluster assembly scaffold protein [Candidatus Aenigmarchaeota archaeon]|nr:iron-sulfur cluster assembly scaffold protein [Candidatus Aenigmarchaeota archaeon]
MIFMVYSKKVMQCFKKPKNMGKMKNPDAVGKVGNIVCGDVMWVYIKIKNNKIKDIKFQTFGCVAAIATSSMVTEIAKGKTIEHALKIKKESILKKLGGLPMIKIHCSMLAIDALHEAIYNYLNKNKQKIPKELEKNHEKIIKILNKIQH